MLAQAASASAEKGVDADALARTARAAKISADAPEKLRTAARTAQEKMRALDAFNGAQLADAMRCFEDENGNRYIDWDPLDDAGKAIKEALEAQEKLSKALAEQINALPAKATAVQQAALEEAMLQCDRRISEIETIILQVTEIAKRHIDGQEIDEATRTRLGRKLVDLAGEQSLQMHDGTRALEALHAGLDPLVRKLDAYATHGTDTVTKAGLRTLTREIDQARNAPSPPNRGSTTPSPTPSGSPPRARCSMPPTGSPRTTSRSATDRSAPPAPTDAKSRSTTPGRTRPTSSSAHPTSPATTSTGSSASATHAPALSSGRKFAPTNAPHSPCASAFQDLDNPTLFAPVSVKPRRRARPYACSRPDLTRNIRDKSVMSERLRATRPCGGPSAGRQSQVS